MCDKTSTLQVLIVLAAGFLAVAPGCDSNPTPHPGRPDALGGRETGVSNQPNEGYVDGPGDDSDRDPAATPDASETGGFTGEDGDVVDGDAGSDAASGDAAPEVEGGEVAPASGDNASACPGEAGEYERDGDDRLEE